MLPDAILYAPINKRVQVSAPNFTRSRARFRGQRESFKINTEIHQLAYDLHKLYEKYDSLNTTLTINLSTIENGGQIGRTLYFTAEGVPGVLYGIAVNWNDASPADESLMLDGTIALIDRLTRLEKRISDLEFGRN